DSGKFTEQQMNNLLPVIINFATKSKISVSDAADVIVKSLTGRLPEELKKLGIDFSNAGTDSERINVLLTTLAQKVDGAGQAFQNTRAGGLASFHQGI